MFKILHPDSPGADEDGADHPSPLREFERSGIEQDAIFKVMCLPGVASGTVECGVRLAEGVSFTRVSFRIEVEPARPTSDTPMIDDKAATAELDRAFKAIFGSGAKHKRCKPSISDTAHVGETRVDIREVLPCRHRSDHFPIVTLMIILGRWSTGQRMVCLICI